MLKFRGYCSSVSVETDFSFFCVTVTGEEQEVDGESGLLMLLFKYTLKLCNQPAVY